MKKKRKQSRELKDYINGVKMNCILIGGNMENMSEEEILKECTELAENEHHELGDCWDEEYSSSAIFGLIMLYKQTKKELNNLKEIEKSHQEENGKLRVELEQEKEKNKDLLEEK